MTQTLPICPSKGRIEFCGFPPLNQTTIQGRGTEELFPSQPKTLEFLRLYSSAEA